MRRAIVAVALIVAAFLMFGREVGTGTPPADEDQISVAFVVSP